MNADSERGTSSPSVAARGGQHRRALELDHVFLKLAGRAILRDVSAELLVDRAMAVAYRLAEYALLNLAEDAAILAFMFC